MATKTYKKIGWLVGDGVHKPTFTDYSYQLFGHKEVIPIFKEIIE